MPDDELPTQVSWTDGGVDLGHDGGLHRHGFEDTLLHVDGAVQRLGQAGRHADPRMNRRRVVEKPGGPQILQPVCDRGQAVRRHPGDVVIQGDGEAGPGEDDGPSAADQPAADDGDPAHSAMPA